MVKSLMINAPFKGANLIGILQSCTSGHTGQLIATVDLHRARTAHSVGAGFTERQRSVLFVLDAIEHGQNGVGFRNIHRKGLPVRFNVFFRVETLNPKLHEHDSNSLRYRNVFQNVRRIRQTSVDSFFRLETGHCDFFYRDPVVRPRLP